MIYIFTDRIDALRQEASQLVQNGLKMNTQRTYTSAQRQYVSFCTEHALKICPASEDQLLTFVAYLNRRKLCHSTISVYLAAVRSLHISEGFPDPLKDCIRLHQALRGIGLVNAAPKQKQPLTYELMLCLYSYVSTSNYDTYMIWAAMNLGYFGLLRASEYCVTQQKFDCNVNVCLSDIEFDHESYMTVFIKSSKTDKYNNGQKIVIGCSGAKVCATCTMTSYVKQRHSMFGSEPNGPLFLFSNGSPLTRSLLNQHIKLMVSLLGLDPQLYSGHSLRAGGATDAARSGLSDWELKFLGRWSSEAYQRYIRLPLEFKASMAKRMIGFSNLK